MNTIAPAAPNTGRILDYWLGGNHHYDVDVIGAREFEAVYAGFPLVFSTLRDYIARVSRSIRAAGIDQFLVLGAGLPTCGNVHEAVPGCRVLYTDIDKENVRIGTEILAGSPNVAYTFCDATDLSTLDGDAGSLLDMSKPVGLVMIGTTAFLPDEVLRLAMERLHQWAPPGSLLALDFDGRALSRHPQALALLDRIGAPLFMRDPESIAPCLTPWTLRDPGIQPVRTWPASPKHPVIAEDEFMFGCVVEKTTREQ